MTHFKELYHKKTSKSIQLYHHFNSKVGRLESDAKIRADLEQARRKYRLALASAKGMRGSGADANVFELIEKAGCWGEKRVDANGMKYWDVGTGKDILKGLYGRTEELQKRAYQYFVSQNKRFVEEAIVDGDSLIFVPKLGRKYVYGDHTNDLDTEHYEMKLRLLPSIFD